MPDPGVRRRLSVVLICLDEEQRLPRALASVSWADEVVVLDSGSSDRTREVAAALGAKVYERRFTNYAEQRNCALRHTTGDWILSLDADEVVTPELAAEIQSVLRSGGAVRGYEIPFKNYIGDRWLRHGGLYPDYHLRLFRREGARFEGAIHEIVHIDGPTSRLQAAIEHFTYRDADHLREKVRRYAALQGAQAARDGTPAAFLAAKIPYRFLDVYLRKGGVLDGRLGLVHACMLTRYAWLVYEHARKARVMAPEP